MYPSPFFLLFYLARLPVYFFNACLMTCSSFSQHHESTDYPATSLFAFVSALSISPRFSLIFQPFRLLLVLGRLKLLLGPTGTILDILSLHDEAGDSMKDFGIEDGVVMLLHAML